MVPDVRLVIAFEEALCYSNENFDGVRLILATVVKPRGANSRVQGPAGASSSPGIVSTRGRQQDMICIGIAADTIAYDGRVGTLRNCYCTVLLSIGAAGVSGAVVTATWDRRSAFRGIGQQHHISGLPRENAFWSCCNIINRLELLEHRFWGR